MYPFNGKEIRDFQKEIDDMLGRIVKQQLELGQQKITVSSGILPCGDGQLHLYGWNKVADETDTVNEDMSCKHEWVNVGFHFDKWVCKKCDVNKGSNE